MTKEEAKEALAKMGLLEALGTQIINDYSQRIRETHDVKILDEAGQMFEAVVPCVIFALMCACLSRGISFSACVQDARDLISKGAEAERVLEPVN